MRGLTLVLGLAGLLACTTGKVIPPGLSLVRSQLPVGNYTMGNITWTGQVVDGGPDEKYTGSSLNDIEAQIARKHRGWAWGKAPGAPALRARNTAARPCE